MDDRCLYYRSGITRSELTGKKWKIINVPLQLSRASSNASLTSSNRHSVCGTPQQQRHQSFGSLVNNSHFYLFKKHHNYFITRISIMLKFKTEKNYEKNGKYYLLIEKLKT